jgi:hypothetical protein
MGAEFTTAVAIENLSQLPIKSSNDTSPYCKIVDYILNNDLPSERIFFQRLIDCMVYELYFPKEIKSAGCEVIKHLSKLPELKTKWSNEQKLQIIKKTYIELSNPENPIGKAMHFMDTIKEVAIIEGKKK